MGLYNAALGLRLRRSVYEIDAELEPATAGRDLRLMVDAGLLEARGETRGRCHVGANEIREIYRDVRSNIGRKVKDPYGSDVEYLSEARQRRVLRVTRS